jgi:hypothetical protein
LRVAHVQLDERARQFLHFPWRGGFAGAQADDHITRANRLAGTQFEFLGDAVALVEQPDHRHPLRHRSCAWRHLRDGLRDVDCFRLRFRRNLALGLGLRDVAVAGGEHRQANEESELLHCVIASSIEPLPEAAPAGEGASP